MVPVIIYTSCYGPHNYAALRTKNRRLMTRCEAGIDPVTISTIQEWPPFLLPTIRIRQHLLELVPSLNHHDRYLSLWYHLMWTWCPHPTLTLPLTLTQFKRCLTSFAFTLNICEYPFDKFSILKKWNQHRREICTYTNCMVEIRISNQKSNLATSLSLKQLRLA